MATLAAGLVIAGLLLGGLETFWRSRGERPTVTDDLKLWAIERDRVYGAEAFVILGASRAQLDLSTEVLKRRLPERKLVLLAVDGSSPWAPLLDLLRDEEFNGTVLVEIAESSFERGVRQTAAQHVQTFRGGVTTNQRLNTLARGVLQERAAVLAAHLSLRMFLIRIVETGVLPRPNYFFTSTDRTRIADYAGFKAQDHAGRLRDLKASYRKRPPSTPEQWAATMSRLEKRIRRLQARGGEVVFVRFPTTGAHFKADERAYPRARYWDPWVKATEATTVHFLDVPGMNDVHCPDGSHLDFRDAPGFTEALLDELGRQGVLAE